jgi:hypothetical protein
MPAVTLRAHYNGDRILLDEPFEIPPNARLMVIVLPSLDAVVGDDWVMAARRGLGAAYGPDEPEYDVSDIR